jgi:hypothetical protein
MAYDDRLTLSNQQKYVGIAKATTQANTRLSDQMTYQLGTNRKSEIQGKIGNTQVSYEKLLTDYILGL